MDKKHFLKLKRELNSLKKDINNLVYEQDKIDMATIKGEDGILDSDFNSEASKQSWNEFFTNFILFGPIGAPVAVGKEVSTWHGEREKKFINDPILYPMENKAKIPVSESWDVKYLNSGTKASDLMEGVKTDDFGEYIDFKTPYQTLKLYLPSSNFFSFYANNNIAYQFTTDNGTKYQLVLELKTEKDFSTLMAGTDLSPEQIQKKQRTDPFELSLTNGDPDFGNGWFWKVSKETGIPYWADNGGKWVGYDMGPILNKDLKSSFALWWDKWGVAAQVIASVAVSFFAPQFGLWLVARVGARWPGTALYSFLQGNTLLGVSLSKPAHFVLSEFLLESVINVSAASIDYTLGNNFGAFMGILFCFFPVGIRMGKIGKFIIPYSDEMVQQLAKKISTGLFENMSPRSFINFLNRLTPAEKIMFSRGLSYLSETGAPESMLKMIKESMEKQIKNGMFPSKFSQWMKNQGREISLTLGSALVYLAGGTVLYYGIQKLKEENADKRPNEEIESKALKNLETLTSEFSDIDYDENLGKSSSAEIVQELFNKEENNYGPRLFYNLSKEDNVDWLTPIVSDIKFKEAKNYMQEKNKLKQFISETDIATTYYNLSQLNKRTTSPEEASKINELIYGIVDSESEIVLLDVIGDNSSASMSAEIIELRNKYPCLKQNFKAISGSYVGLDYWIKFKYVGENQIKLKSKTKIVPISKDDYIYLYNDGHWRSDSHRTSTFNEFGCP